MAFTRLSDSDSPKENAAPEGTLSAAAAVAAPALAVAAPALAAVGRDDPILSRAVWKNIIAIDREGLPRDSLYYTLVDPARSGSLKYIEFISRDLLARDKLHVGLKLHVSVAVTSENMERAWNCLLPILVRYGVNEFKVASPALMRAGAADSAILQPGKAMVIYCMNERADFNWKGMLREIEREFQSRGVVPGEVPHKRHDVRRCPCTTFFGVITRIDGPEAKVVGSEYLYYTDDSLPPEAVIPSVPFASIADEASVGAAVAGGGGAGVGMSK